ncbi:hypothetical protein KEM54_003168, partial [Ascosphaera aggregata]
PVYSLIIINKAGGLIYQRDFHPSLKKLSTNDYLVLAGTFHGVHEITKQLTPRLQSPPNAPPPASQPQSASPTASIFSNITRSIERQSTGRPTSSGGKHNESTTTSIIANGYPVPSTRPTGLEVLESKLFKMTCFSTVTGTKFLLFTDPAMQDVDVVMAKVYEFYADYAMKNPFYSLDMPVRCDGFDRGVNRWLKSRVRIDLL